MKLSAQEKLALAATGYSSVRAMARELGITHQKLGRWLREGEAGGVKKIPDDFFTAEAINSFFAEHKNRVQETAKVTGAPALPVVPVYMERRHLDKTTPQGEPILGDRVIVNHAQFIRAPLRQEIMREAVKTKRFFAGGVRSFVDAVRYATQKVREEIAQGKRDPRGEKAAIKKYSANIMHKQSREMKIAEERYIQAVYTRGEDFRPGRDPDDVAMGIEQKLRIKHQTAAVGPKAVFAESYSFQLTPQRHENESTRPTRGNRGRIKGRGAK